MEFFIYLLFRRKHVLHCISHSLSTPSPNESPAKLVSFGKGGTRSSVDVTAQARPHDLMALFGRNKRYNTLDLASKIVCQRQASPALLWKPPGYRQTHFRASNRNVFCRYSFSPVCHKNAKSVFVATMENERVRDVRRKSITFELENNIFTISNFRCLAFRAMVQYKHFTTARCLLCLSATINSGSS